MRQAVEAAREAWGLATMIGVAGKGETLDIVPRLLITGRRVTGSSFGGVKGRTQVPELVDRWLAGEIDVDALVTARIPLDEVNEAFEAMERQEGIRTVISFSLRHRNGGTVIIERTEHPSWLSNAYLVADGDGRARRPRRLERHQRAADRGGRARGRHDHPRARHPPPP